VHHILHYTALFHKLTFLTVILVSCQVRDEASLTTFMKGMNH